MENAKDSIQVPLSPSDEFVEQCRVALLVYQVISKDAGLGTMNFRNKGKKRWIKENKKAFEDQIENFANFGKRSFYWEVRGMEFRKGELENPVRAVPDRDTLIRVELKQFLAFITLGI